MIVWIRGATTVEVQCRSLFSDAGREATHKSSLSNAAFIRALEDRRDHGNMRGHGETSMIRDTVFHEHCKILIRLAVSAV